MKLRIRFQTWFGCTPASVGSSGRDLQLSFWLNLKNNDETTSSESEARKHLVFRYSLDTL